MSNAPLTRTEIDAALPGLPGWSQDGQVLHKIFEFSTFRDAIAFMLRVGDEAEAMNHHPDWSNVYNRVTIRLNTHDAGGRITALDVALARKIETVLASR